MKVRWGWDLQIRQRHSDGTKTEWCLEKKIAISKIKEGEQRYDKRDAVSRERLRAFIYLIVR